VLASIRTLKMYAWEGLFEERVMEARKREVKSLAVRSRFNGFKGPMSVLLARLVSFSNE
jgi:hypothetical protein